MKTDKYVCNLSKELVDTAKKELGEKPERRDADIEAVRQWLKKNSYINADTSAKCLLSFLRVSKFSLERTKKRMELYYSVKTASPEFYSKLDPRNPTIQYCLKAGVILPLEGVDNQGRRLVLCRPNALDPTKLKNMDACMRYSNMIYAIMMDEWEELAITGLVLIQDNKDYNAAFLTLMTPTFMKKAFRMWQDCMPIRFKSCHNVYTSGVFMTAWKLMKPFMKEKLRNRMHLHGDNFEALYDHVPKDILPKEYGGNAGTIQDLTDTWKKKVESKREWLQEQEHYKSDESKRPGPKRDLEAELFGIEGSFRKLEID